jgi:hypothetical protein
MDAVREKFTKTEIRLCHKQLDPSEVHHNITNKSINSDRLQRVLHNERDSSRPCKDREILQLALHAFINT